MSAGTGNGDTRCTAVDPVWDRQCELPAGHEGVHRNVEPGDAVTWGTAAQVRAYERGVSS